MGNILLIDPIEDPRWDTFVENHPFGQICHLSGWKQVLEKSFNQMKGYYLVLLDNTGNTIRAALPLFEIRSWLTGNRLVSIPFANACDPLISTNDEMEELFESALDLSKELGASYIEIRTLASSSFIQDPRLGVSRFFKHHYLPLESDPEQLKRSFHRTWVTQNIKRAMKSNLRLRVADNESDVHSFYRLYSMMRRRLGLPPQPYAFFKMLWDIFSPSGRITILLAELDGHPIAGLVLLKFKVRVSAEYAGWDRKFQRVCPNHYLYWEAIKSACYEGYKILDLSRTSPHNVNLMDFKSHWGMKIVDLPQFYYPEEICSKIAEREKSLGYKAINKLSKRIPNYACQLLGDFLYRHMG